MLILDIGIPEGLWCPALSFCPQTWFLEAMAGSGHVASVHTPSTHRQLTVSTPFNSEMSTQACLDPEQILFEGQTAV